MNNDTQHNNENENLSISYHNMLSVIVASVGCFYAEVSGALMFRTMTLSITLKMRDSAYHKMLSVIVMSVIMLSVFMLMSVVP